MGWFWREGTEKGVADREWPSAAGVIASAPSGISASAYHPGPSGRFDPGMVGTGPRHMDVVLAIERYIRRSDTAAVAVGQIFHLNRYVGEVGVRRADSDLKRLDFTTGGIKLDRQPITRDSVTGTTSMTAGITFQPRLTNDVRSRVMNSLVIIFTY